jgi:hypothetical protein
VDISIVGKVEEAANGEQSTAKEMKKSSDEEIPKKVVLPLN